MQEHGRVIDISKNHGPLVASSPNRDGGRMQEHGIRTGSHGTMEQENSGPAEEIKSNGDGVEA
jgi:hypothetical protein